MVRWIFKATLLCLQNLSYNVLVSDANECYTLSENIQIDSSLECIEMTNTFSPNNDGINDFWNLNFPRL